MILTLAYRERLLLIVWGQNTTIIHIIVSIYYLYVCWTRKEEDTPYIYCTLAIEPLNCSSKTKWVVRSGIFLDKRHNWLQFELKINCLTQSGHLTVKPDDMIFWHDTATVHFSSNTILTKLRNIMLQKLLEIISNGQWKVTIWNLNNSTNFCYAIKSYL